MIQAILYSPAKRDVDPYTGLLQIWVMNKLHSGFIQKKKGLYELHEK